MGKADARYCATAGVSTLPLSCGIWNAIRSIQDLLHLHSGVGQAVGGIGQECSFLAEGYSSMPCVLELIGVKSA